MHQCLIFPLRQCFHSSKSLCWPWKLNRDYTLFNFTRLSTSFTRDIPFTMLKRPILWLVRIETLWTVSLVVMTVRSASTTIHQGCQIPTMPAGYQAMVTPKESSLPCFPLFSPTHTPLRACSWFGSVVTPSMIVSIVISGGARVIFTLSWNLFTPALTSTNPVAPERSCVCAFFPSGFHYS